MVKARAAENAALRMEISSHLRARESDGDRTVTFEDGGDEEAAASSKRQRAGGAGGGWEKGKKGEGQWQGQGQIQRAREGQGRPRARVEEEGRARAIVEVNEKPDRCFETMQHGCGYTHPLGARGAVPVRGDPYPFASGLSYASRTINGAPCGVARMHQVGRPACRPVGPEWFVGGEGRRCAALEIGSCVRPLLRASDLPGAAASCCSACGGCDALLCHA